MQHLIKTVLFCKLLDNERGLADASLAEVDAGEEAERHPLAPPTFAALHCMLICRFVVALHQVYFGCTVLR